MSIRVLFADGSEIVRQATRKLFQEEPQIELVGEASNFTEAIRLADRLKPQVIVMHLHMEDEDKFAPQDIKTRLTRCGSRIVATSLLTDAKTKEFAQRVGATILLDKTELGTELLPVIARLTF